MLAKNGTHDDNDDEDAIPLFSRTCLLSLSLRFLRVVRFHCLCRTKGKNNKKESRYDRENYPRIGQGCLDPSQFHRHSFVSDVLLVKSPLFFVIFGKRSGLKAVLGITAIYCMS